MPKRFVPPISWLKTYDRDNLKGDLSAGVIVAIMLVPQAMAYAMLAGLPPVIGLYAATFPLVAYAFFGTSRQLAVGPVAIVSLLVATACARVAVPGGADYIAAVTMLTLLVGVIQMALGVLRAGFLINFVSQAVISGFTSAAAIVIALSQLKHILGVNLKGSHSSVQLVFGAATRIGETHWPTLALGLAATAVLFLFKKKWPRFPSALLVAVTGTLVVYLLRLDKHGVEILGEVPRGLPGVSVPSVSLTSLLTLLPDALVIVFVGFMESIAVAQWIASREKYRVDANREFVGLGLANMVSSLLSGYTVTGGFSRTAVNYQAGAKTPFASIVTAAIVLLTLLLLTPLFHYLPNVILGAVIVVAVSGLVDVGQAVRLFRVKKVDGWTLVVTFAVTLTVGIHEGILSGILFSLVLFVARSSRPHTAVLGYVEDQDAYHDRQRYPTATDYPELIVIRVDASLYFANARFVEDRVREQLALKPEANWVLMDMSGVNDVDGVAVSTLSDLMDDCAHRGVQLAFAGMKAQVRDVLVRAGWQERLGKAMDYPTLRAAVHNLRQRGGNAATP